MTSHDQAALPAQTQAPASNRVFADDKNWLARLAHDLRSPLVAIGYASQMLRSGRAPPQRTSELFATIDRQTAQLAKLADQIGDMLLIGRERFALRHGHCDLVALVREALLDAAPGSAASATFAGGNAVGVSCDRPRLVQLLRHVIKLTGKRKPGTALPAIEVQGDPAGAHVRVIDPAGAIYRSDALLYLAHGTEPQDPGVLSMSDIIARRILDGHDATLTPGDFTDNRTATLSLTLPTA